MRKYPLSLFIVGVVMNFFLRFFYLFILGSVLCIIGIWVKTCQQIGIALLCVDLIFSTIEQFKIRKEVLRESENEEFNELMDAACGPDGLNGVLKNVTERIQSAESIREQDERERAESQEVLQKLVVYRTLRGSIQDGMTLDEMIDAFAKMCEISMGDPDSLLFEVGNFDFTGEKMFYFNLVRQFQFLDPDEYVQLHLEVLYKPDPKTRLLFKVKWCDPADDSFFQTVRNSLAYKVVKNMPIEKVDIRIEET